MSNLDAAAVPKFPEKGFYYHYKHDSSGSVNNYAYEVTGFARHTEDKSFFVIYVPLYETDWFKPADFQARPLAMFKENIEKSGSSVPRFTRITDAGTISELTEIRNKMYS